MFGVYQDKVALAHLLFHEIGTHAMGVCGVGGDRDRGMRGKGSSSVKHVTDEYRSCVCFVCFAQEPNRIANLHVS